MKTHKFDVALNHNGHDATAEVLVADVQGQMLFVVDAQVEYWSGSLFTLRASLDSDNRGVFLTVVEVDDRLPWRFGDILADLEAWKTPARWRASLKAAAEQVGQRAAIAAVEQYYR